MKLFFALLVLIVTFSGVFGQNCEFCNNVSSNDLTRLGNSLLVLNSEVTGTISQIFRQCYQINFGVDNQFRPCNLFEYTLLSDYFFFDGNYVSDMMNFGAGNEVFVWDNDEISDGYNSVFQYDSNTIFNGLCCSTKLQRHHSEGN
eukprot:TRINITY_DN267_c0_g3_i5.p1 TRINITY_DN267_c0_g3~~TRINITY_DN267_c0_g3_i5.p1  ORF type:complete len:145 (+),score=12.09 TRINITY_DN267_c0_g3_i5:147-581(+)